MRHATNTGMAILAALMALAALPASGQSFTVHGRPLAPEEKAAARGGETYVEVDAERSRAVVTSLPRDSYGLDYSRASSYTVEVRNKIIKKEQVGENDFYEPTTFPTTTAKLGVRTISDAARQKRYGGSQGEWITTDAVTTVTAYPRDADGKSDHSKPYTRKDSGYFWHANNAAAWEDSVSAGCLLSRKTDLDRVISTLKADSGRKTIKVN